MNSTLFQIISRFSNLWFQIHHEPTFIFPKKPSRRLQLISQQFRFWFNTKQFQRHKNSSPESLIASNYKVDKVDNINSILSLTNPSINPTRIKQTHKFQAHTYFPLLYLLLVLKAHVFHLLLQAREKLVGFVLGWYNLSSLRTHSTTEIAWQHLTSQIIS